MLAIPDNTTEDKKPIYYNLKRVCEKSDTAVS